MNIFLPDSVANTSKYLDDKRLNKQILECYQIYQVYLNKSKGYASHPITKFYIERPVFLVLYGYAVCCEFRYRFNHEHTYEKFFFDEFSRDYENYVEDVDDLVCYIAGSKGNPDRVEVYESLFEADRVNELYREKLINKWNEDIKNGRSPKWTHREIPSFVKFENGLYIRN